MKLLLAGPPGSGKTTRILAATRARLRASGEDFRLIVPTSTMAEHLRNLLAREGFSFRGSLVCTLAGFAKAVTGIPQPAGPAAISLALDDWLGPASCPPAFRDVARFPGFRTALARTLDDLATAGCDALRLSALRQLGILRGALPGALVNAMEHVEAALASRGEAFRSGHLAALASGLRRAPLPALREAFFDGFFSFTPAELQVVQAVAGFASVTVSLPAWPGAESAIESLRAAGFRLESLHPVRSQPRERLVAAPSREREADEIARRILDHASRGRPWREMGVILRRQTPYAPLFQTVFARFGIPARFYFRRPLATQSSVRFLAAAIDRLQGADYDSPQAPVKWVPILRKLIPLLEAPPPGAPRHPWQGRAASIRAFYSALEQTASLLPAGPVPLARFWHAARLVLESADLPPESAPRDAVHVLDVYEARQWELPVVFLSGLLEGEFPLHPSPDPLLPDSLRLKLRAAGVPVAVGSTRAQEEAFYLDLARTRATDEVVLSWPLFDAQGDPNLRSFALASLPGDLPPPPRIRLQTAVECRTLPEPRIYSEPLQTRLAKRYEVQRPTALESFLQCPFLFFGRYSLKLKEPGGDDQLDPLTLGSFVHGLLDEWHRDPQDIERLLDRRWSAFLLRTGIPPGWRPEFERLRLLRGLRRFAAEPYFREGWTVHTEKVVTLDLDGLRLAGRIDRYDQSPEGRAQVFDFKLSGDASVRNKIKKSGEGLLLQAGLYSLALQRLGLTVESAWFVPLRGSERAGWEDPEAIEQLISAARASAEQAQRLILAGIIAPKPADEDLCAWCEFRDACRVKTAVRGAVATP